jgi:hypothetical protein
MDDCIIRFSSTPSLWNATLIVAVEAEFHQKNYITNLVLIKTTVRLHDNNQLINAVWGNNRCLFWETRDIHKYTQWANYRVNKC